MIFKKNTFLLMQSNRRIDDNIRTIILNENDETSPQLLDTARPQPIHVNRHRILEDLKLSNLELAKLDSARDSDNINEEINNIMNNHNRSVRYVVVQDINTDLDIQDTYYLEEDQSLQIDNYTTFSDSIYNKIDEITQNSSKLDTIKANIEHVSLLGTTFNILISISIIISSFYLSKHVNNIVKKHNKKNNHHKKSISIVKYLWSKIKFYIIKKLI